MVCGEVSAEQLCRRDEPENLQLCGMKLVREIVEIRSDLGCALGHDVRARPHTWRVAESELIDIDGQQRDLLAEIVVKLARDARALDFLRGDEAAGEPSRILLAYLQCMFVDSQGTFRAAPPRSLKQQAGDQAALNREHRQDAGDVGPVLLPERVLAKLDVGAGRQQPGIDVPLTELSPVHSRARREFHEGRSPLRACRLSVGLRCPRPFRPTLRSGTQRLRPRRVPQADPRRRKSGRGPRWTTCSRASR